MKGNNGIDKINIIGKVALSLLSAYGGIIPIYKAALALVKIAAKTTLLIPQKPSKPQKIKTIAEII